MARSNIINVSNNKHLFIDNCLIESTKNITLKVNPPTKAGRLENLNEFEMCSWFAVLEQKNQMRIYGWKHTRIDQEKYKYELWCVFSNDGVTVENIVPCTVQGKGYVICGSVFVDPNGSSEDRFKMFSTVWEEGVHAREDYLCVFTSPDGIQWSRHKPKLLRFRCDSHNQAFWDDRIGEYVAYLRGWDLHRKRCLQSKRYGEPKLKGASPRWGERVIKRCEVDDIMKSFPVKPDKKPHYFWGTDHAPAISTEMPTVLCCDEDDPPESDLYNPSVVKYPWAANVYLAFPSAYYHYPPPPEGKANSGVLEVQLATSRDGVKWRRFKQPPYVRLGLENEEDAGMVYMAIGMIRRGDYIYQYYKAIPWIHGDREARKRALEDKTSRLGLCRLVQRLDGFVSADSAYTGGELTTRPLVFNGSHLTLNINTSAMGETRVALLKSSGKPYQEHSIEDCDLINCNSTNKIVTWKGKSGVNKISGKPVQLQFVMRNTKLYSFQFKR